MRKRVIRFWVVVACSLGAAALGDGDVAIKVGSNAPDFSVPDQQGRNVTLQQFANKIVVLEWFDPLCDYTKRDYQAHVPQKLAEKYKEKEVVWLAVNSTRDSTQDHNRAWAKDNDLKVPVLDDGRKRTSTLYGINTVPAFVIVDQHGKVVYTGAIDDNQDIGVAKGEGRFHYVDRALEELTTGKAVTIPSSKLFGCPLK